LLRIERDVQREMRLEAGHAARLVLDRNGPISLDFREAPLSALLAAIKEESGVNFVLDRDVKAEQRATLFIRSAPLESAIDLVLSAFNLSRRVVDPVTLLIYPNTPDKHKEHREQMVRVFHLSHAPARS